MFPTKPNTSGSVVEVKYDEQVFSKLPSLSSLNVRIALGISAKCCRVCKVKVLLLKNNLFFFNTISFYIAIWCVILKLFLGVF